MLAEAPKTFFRKSRRFLILASNQMRDLILLSVNTCVHGRAHACAVERVDAIRS